MRRQTQRPSSIIDTSVEQREQDQKRYVARLAEQVMLAQLTRYLPPPDEADKFVTGCFTIAEAFVLHRLEMLK